MIAKRTVTRSFTYRALGGMFFSLVLGGCPQDNPLALIHYTQLGACRSAQTGNGVVNVPPSHAVVIFKISTIDNTKIGTSWSFDSTALTVNPPSAVQQNLGGQGPVPIPANQNVTINRFVGIMVETSNADGTDAASVNYFLLYPRVPPAPGTLGVKDNSGQVQYPFNPSCSAIAGG